MRTFIKITAVLLTQLLYGLTAAGCIISLHNDDLVLALLFAAGYSCMHGLWKEVEFDLMEGENGSDIP